LQGVADQFVRVRLSRVDPLDLNLFEFDYDLTLAYFFLDAEDRVYARYGGRDSESPDHRQSLAGLRYTMESVLKMHAVAEKSYAPKPQDSSKYLRDGMGGKGGGRCYHCHQVREVLNQRLVREGKWTNDLAFRYPLPENVGLELEVDRGNIVKAVRPKSPAAAVGIRPGDRLHRLFGVPIHSQADVQYALDRSPRSGKIDAQWQHGDESGSADLDLADGWKRGSITWRPSIQHLVPSARLYGKDLDAAERTKLGLSPTQLAFRQDNFVPTQAKQAGVKASDIILGIDGKTLEMDVVEFVHHIRSRYLVGETVTIQVLRDGQRLDLSMKLLP
jgi:hypothetical protein